MKIITQEDLPNTYVEIQSLVFSSEMEFRTMFACVPDSPDTCIEGRQYWDGEKLGEAIVRLSDGTILERAWYMPRPIKNLGYNLLRKVGSLDEFWSVIKHGGPSDELAINQQILGYTPLTSFSAYIHSSVEAEKKTLSESSLPADQFRLKHFYL